MNDESSAISEAADTSNSNNRTIIRGSDFNNTASTIFTTPQQNGHHVINSQTVTKKRVRQQTVTVENNLAKEIEGIFSRVKEMPGLENPMEELQRQMQAFFIQKDREWEYKCIEAKESMKEELALCKVKLKATEKLQARTNEFLQQLSAKAPAMMRHNSSNGSLAGMQQQNGGGDGLNNGAVTPQTARTFSPDLLVELGKERDSLREELAQLENSYSDLFKRYEKMRENCVLLKNSEEELKNLLEEETTKYERLLDKFQELRASAAHQLEQANAEINRIMKQHEENTLGLRCRLKMNETQMKTLNMTIQGKDAQIEELNGMVEELMKKNGIVDDEGMDESDGGGSYE